jgi:hypothetical protein
MRADSRRESPNKAIAHTMLVLEHGEAEDDEVLEAIIHHDGSGGSIWDIETVVGLQDTVSVLLRRLEAATGEPPLRTLQAITRAPTTPR